MHMKKPGKSLAVILVLTLIVSLFSVTGLLANEPSNTGGALRYEWIENFEHGNISHLKWTNVVSTPGSNAQPVNQSFVGHGVDVTGPAGTTPGVNSDPGSTLMGRYFVNNQGGLRSNRFLFREAIDTSSVASIAFDWFPGQPTMNVASNNSYGQLSFNNISHFNSLNYLSLITTTNQTGMEDVVPGVYLHIGTTGRNNATNVALNQLGLGPDDLITTNQNAWYRVFVSFNFAGRTMDIVITESATGAPVFSRIGVGMAEEDYKLGQITGLHWIANRVAAGNMSWNSYMDNLHVRVYGDPVKHPFGMPQNVTYTPVTYDSVTVNWDAMVADSFNIYRRHGTDAESKMTLIGTVPGNVWTFTDEGLLDILEEYQLLGHYFWYAVSAVQGGVESPRTRDAFIQLDMGSYYTSLINIPPDHPLATETRATDGESLLFSTGELAGFSNRLRIGDLSGNGRNDILLTNTLAQSGRNFMPGSPNWTPPNNTSGPTTVFTYQDGVWTPSPGTGTTSTTGDGTAARVIFSLTAIDIEGNVLWQRCAATGMRGFDGYSREISTGADEPVQIGDVTGDGFNNVVLVANPGVLFETAPPWINSVPEFLRNHAEWTWRDSAGNVTTPSNYQNRFYQVANDVFYVLDGRTGDIARDVNGREMFISYAEMATRPNAPSLAVLNGVHDHITLVDLDGRGWTGHVLMSNRYSNLTAWEIVNREGEFVMNFMWLSQVTGFGDGVGHKPLGYPIYANEGDYRDWVFGNQRLHHPETGEIMWRYPAGFIANNPHTFPVVRNPGGHTDSIQIGDRFDDGQLHVDFGVDGMQVGTSFNARTGEMQWIYDYASELQSHNMGWYRTDADGMLTFGLERRNRGAWPIGHDGLFIIGPRGEALFLEPNNMQGWMTTSQSANNWTGTFSTMGFAFNRNFHALENGSPEALNPDNMVPTAFYDGYFNLLFDVPDAGLMSGTRFMQADFIGDSREELVAFTDYGYIMILASGTQEPDLTSHVGETPRRQTRNLANWTRYNVAEFVNYFSDRTASSPLVRRISEDTVEISLPPIILAESYTLYHNGEVIATFDPRVDDLRFVVSNLAPDTDHEFSYTASKFDFFWNRMGTTARSVPAIVTTGPLSLTFHVYSTNNTILDAFDEYTTDGVIVVTVEPGTAPNLGDVLNLGHIYGTAEAHGYAFWGWFDDEMLDESGRRRAGLRRPALDVSSADAWQLADILAIIENGTEEEWRALLISEDDGNLNLYGVWVRWGDVDDNGQVIMSDLNLLQREVNFGHVMDVELSRPAADVLVDDVINMGDLTLLQRHFNLGHIMQVILGAEPQ